MRSAMRKADKKLDMTAGQHLAGALLSVALMGLAFAVKGVVLSDLWGWFVVPLGAPPIPTWMAMGILLVAAAPLTSVHRALANAPWVQLEAIDSIKAGPASMIWYMLRPFVMTAMLWGLGWAIHAVGAG